MAIRSLSADSAPKQNTTDTTTTVAGSSTPASIAKLSRLAKRILVTGCVGLAVVSSTGCMMSPGFGRALNKSECIDDFMIRYRNKVMAEKAWHRNKHRFCDKIFANEFKDGFIQGYINIATGGNGCTPAIAPSNYWGWRYQSAQGQAAVSTWFEGFPHGVQAAEQDGVGHWQSVTPMGMNSATALPVYTPISSGDDAMTNPLNSEPEYVPTPQPFLQVDPEDAKADPFQDDAAMDDAANVFNQAFGEFPVHVERSHQDPELVWQLDGARSDETAIATTLTDRVEQAPEAAAVVIDGIFGSTAPTDTPPGSEELPFSFE